MYRESYTIALTGFAGIALIGRHHATLELFFLDIEMELCQVSVNTSNTQERKRIKKQTFLKLPSSPLTQNRNCSSSGLTTPALAVTINPDL